ncbi:hypothetical protein EFP84_20765 [Leptospira kmetyi]|uniref:Uncharacterized protein n=1 Tax=Leptospira kmetyi TaxID=408139 RepID=A0AAD0XSP2_9LEPT|nr:hypothetical protein EFP84_20765 [Leptospira kmetyi]
MFQSVVCRKVCRSFFGLFFFYFKATGHIKVKGNLWELPQKGKLSGRGRARNEAKALSVENFCRNSYKFPGKGYDFQNKRLADIKIS